VIAATSATDTALDSRYRGEASPFTRLLADGLRAKAVDRNNDGAVDLDDLFFYLDGLAVGGLAPRRKYDGSGAVPIARRPIRSMDSPERHSESSLIIAESPGGKPTERSGFLDRSVPYASFSPERVGSFRASMRKDIVESMPEQLTATEFLQRAGLMQHGGITYAGVLLFSDSPTLTLPSAMIQCARFRGTTKIGPLESKEIHGPVPDLIVQARDFVANAARLGEIPTAEGAYAATAYSFPMIAVREIIANAIVHRDYESHETCVQLHIFSDRIEIISPGSWEGIDDAPGKSRRLNQLERPSWRRNFRLARILTWSRLVEGVGAGLPRAVADCKSVGAPEPVVAIGDGLVAVTIFPRKVGYGTSGTRFASAEPDPRQQLALRLRALREDHWPDVRVTQTELARALGGDRPVSVPLISSWESRSAPRVPPTARLQDYAAFFSTTRSVAGAEPRLLSTAEMTDAERRVRDELAEELMRLRHDALQPSIASVDKTSELLSAGPWRFEDGRAITIVCAKLPAHMWKEMPYTDRGNPDHVELYNYADLDALFELYGHIRASNPSSQVNFRAPEQLTPDDYTTHLVGLGSVDWSQTIVSVLDRLQFPVRQVPDLESPDGSYFEVSEDEGNTLYRPSLEQRGEGKILVEDVALFARATNPFNSRRSVTICQGVYGIGTYGIVRALTDARFRDRNTEYINDRFAGSESFVILTRVKVLEGVALTPDWTYAEYQLFEWSRSEG
jgi:hypothetical protein